MDAIKNALAGFKVPPAIVAGVRGIILAAVSAVLTLLLSYITSDAISKEYAAYVPVAIFVLRQLEGFVDQKRDPAQNEMPPLDTVTPGEAAAIVENVHTVNTLLKEL